MSQLKDRRPKALGTARAYHLIEERCRLSEAGYRPFVHQADGLATAMERLERYGSAAILHDMGCGKTITALSILLEAHAEGRAQAMLVVCPGSVIGAWENECAALNKRGTRIECLGLTHASVPRREAALIHEIMMRDARAAAGEQLPPLVVATNYESVWRMEAALKLQRFDIVLCDESQRIKAPGSKQSLSMYRIGKTAGMRVVMTGTPVPEGGLDWYGQWRFADPELLGTSYTNFKARFAIEIPMMGSTGKEFRKVIINPHNKDELERLVMQRSHRVAKEDAVDLPEQTPVKIEFELTPRQRKIYDDLVRDSIAFLERDGLGHAMGTDEPAEVVGDNVLTRMLRLQQICGGYVQAHGADSVEPADPKKNPKLSALVDLMETLRDAGSKLVIFHRFTHEGDAIAAAAKRLCGKAQPVSVINGSVPSSERRGQIKQFQEGDASLFVGQIQACAEGITLHAAADTALYSMPFSSAVYLQALARVHRIGQESPVTHHHLIALRTIDEAVYDTQEKKRDAAAEMVDGGWRRFLTGE